MSEIGYKLFVAANKSPEERTPEEQSLLDNEDADNGKNMTKDEILSKYGDLQLSFQSYYKYAFTYVGSLGAESIEATFSGNGEDIYREEFEPVQTISGKDYLLKYLVIRVGDKVIYEDNPNPDYQ